MHLKTSHIKNFTILFVIFNYLLFDYGFQLIRIPGSGIPSGELVIILFTFLLIKDIKYFPSFYKNSPALLLCTWFSVGIIQAIHGTIKYDIWALRDATFVVESFFIWIGFVVAANRYLLSKLMLFIKILFITTLIYSLGYPIREYLQSISPMTISANGKITPIMFNYIVTPNMILLGIFQEIIKKHMNIVKSIFIGMLLMYIAAFWQGRTIYLQIIALLLIIILLKRKVFKRIYLIGLVGFFCLLFISISGIELEGRLGEKISLNFLFDHFQAIWGKATEQTEDSAYGINWRYEMWIQIIRSLLEYPSTFLFGLGFGQPLVSFLGPEGEIVRIPHNTIMTILGRMGVFGLLLFLAIHIFLIKIWLRTYKFYKKINRVYERDLLLVLLWFFILVIIYGIGEGSVELPYLAIPYYFFWGVVIRMSANMRKAKTRYSQGNFMNNSLKSLPHC